VVIPANQSEEGESSVSIVGIKNTGLENGSNMDDTKRNAWHVAPKELLGCEQQLMSEINDESNDIRKIMNLIKKLGCSRHGDCSSTVKGSPSSQYNAS